MSGAYKRCPGVYRHCNKCLYLMSIYSVVSASDLLCNFVFKHRISARISVFSVITRPDNLCVAYLFATSNQMCQVISQVNVI